MDERGCPGVNVLARRAYALMITHTNPNHNLQGSVEESIKAAMGYTFPEAVFSGVTEFVSAYPREVVTILMMATHGNTAPSGQ